MTSRLGPTTRFALVKRMRELGWDGPHRGGNHAFMVKGTHKVRIPNQHKGDIRLRLMTMILQQAGISQDEWLGKND